MSTDGLVVGIGNRSLVIKVNGGFPPTPTSLVVAVASPTRLNLSWSLVSSNERSVKVERSLNGVSGWSLMATLAAGSTSYADTTVSPSTLYFYRVSTVNRKGSSAYATGSQTTPGTVSPPAAPSGLTGTPISSSRVNLSWTDNSADETGFELYRSAAGAGSWTLIVTTTAGVTTYQDTGLTAGASYDYRVRAINTAGQSSYSTASGVTLQTIATPTGLGAVVGGSTSVALAWTDAATNETAYSVERSTTGLSGSWTVLTSSLPAGTVSYNDTGLSPGTLYYWRVRATDGANSSSYSNTASATTDPISATLQVLPSRVIYAQSKPSGTARQQAQANSFKSILNSRLSALAMSDAAGGGGYQASWFFLVADFALGYQVWKASDSTFATKCAEKAVALLDAALGSYPTSLGTYTQNYKYIARGNGSNKVFTLPETPTGSFEVKIDTVSIRAVTHSGTANSQDNWGIDGGKILKVSNTSDGPADYAEGVDWRYNTDWIASKIDWSLAGIEPAPGATYYITWAWAYSATLVAPTNYTLSGNTLTFGAGFTAPTANQVIFAQYMYTNPSNGNIYWQTNDTLGGYHNIYPDSGFVTKGHAYLAAAYDWIYDYGNIPSSLRTRLEDLLYRWALYAKDGTGSPDGNYPYGYQNGYQHNYNGGHFRYRSWAAACLSGRVSGAAGVASDLVSFRSTYLQPDWLADPNTGTFVSFKGGWDPEGWPDYGANVYENYGGGTLADYEAGIFTDISSEQGHLNSAIKCYIHTLASPRVFYPSGKFGTYPGRPIKDHLKVTGYIATDATAKGYIANLQQNLTNSPALTIDAIDMMFRDPDATPIDWTTTEPPYYFSPGGGLVLSRKDWTNNGGMFVSLECGNQHRATNAITQACTYIFRTNGTDTADDLLVNATEFAQSENFVSNQVNGNALCLDTTNGQGVSWVHPHDVTITVAEQVTAYTYAECDYRWTYTTNNVTTPANELTRAMVHIRAADLVFYYDRATRASAGTLQLQWYFATTPTLTGDAWVVPFTCTDLAISASFSNKVTSATLDFNAAFAGRPLQVTGGTGFTPVTRTITAIEAGNVAVLSGSVGTPGSTGGSATLGGGSKLFGKTFSTSGIVSVADAPSVAGLNVNRVKVNPAVSSSTIRYATVMQAAPSTTASMVATAFITSSGGKLEGILAGQSLVLFGKILTSSGATGYRQAVPESYSYTGVNAVVYTHVICDLVPGRTYTLTGANQPTATASAAGVIVFLTTGTGSPQTIGLA